MKDHPSKRALVRKPTYCIYPSHECASHENTATITELIAIKIAPSQPFKYDIWYLERSRKLSTSLLKTLTPIYFRRIISKVCKWDFFFFYLGFLSGTFTIHRTAGERGGHLFNSSLPLPPASQTLRH